ncbi:Hsp20/alpha crystallin family protein [Antricoccus suffuscus]|uniref:Hsp20/alpha crystallin family protein n=1 Tax=Antricoccus suffuscus TaxID=1629062 RepID=A0A2T0ZTJ6_9ACTN|nr:Hsp20/alpha crystallin family protein [Antricoccus suffuscus]
MHHPLHRVPFRRPSMSTEKINASYQTGVLTLTIPVAEKAKPRKIEISSNSDREAINA